MKEEVAVFPSRIQGDPKTSHLGSPLNALLPSNSVTERLSLMYGALGTFKVQIITVSLLQAFLSPSLQAANAKELSRPLPV